MGGTPHFFPEHPPPPPLRRSLGLFCAGPGEGGRNPKSQWGEEEVEERRKKRRQEGRRHKHHGRKISPLPEKRKKSAPLLAAFLSQSFFSLVFSRREKPRPEKNSAHIWSLLFCRAKRGKWGLLGKVGGGRRAYAGGGEGESPERIPPRKEGQEWVRETVCFTKTSVPWRLWSFLGGSSKRQCEVRAPKNPHLEMASFASLVSAGKLFPA